MNNYPKYYIDACSGKPNDYLDYDNYEIKYGEYFHYQIVQKASKGNYSEVFEGIDVRTNRKVIIKVLKPIKSSKIKREIKMLKLLNGACNTIKLLDVVRFPNSKTPALIFEHINNSCEQDFRAFYASLSQRDIKFYFLEILKALDYMNSMGIMHRDIKPHNIVIDHEKKQLKIIDFGLAEFYVPDQEYNVRVASRYFKAPELLLSNPRYHYSVDIWALGCLLAGIIFMKEPFFAGQDSNEQLVKIAKVTGSESILAYINKYGLKPENQLIHDTLPSKSFHHFVTDQNKARISEEAIELLEKMLVVDHNQRITAKDAMNHAFFKAVRYRSAQRSSKDRKSKQSISTLTKGLKISENKSQFNYRRASPQPWSDQLKCDQMQGIKKTSNYVLQNKENILNPDTFVNNNGQKKSIPSADDYKLSSSEIPDSNINVVVRIRPILQKEQQNHDLTIVRTNDKNEIFIIDPKDLMIKQSRENSQNRVMDGGYKKRKPSKDYAASSTQHERCYSFDSVFDNESTNKIIYQRAIKQLTKVVLNGYNATIFAYGVTGAGKTHTMIGYENEPGLMYYTINEIFDGMRAMNHCSTSSHRKQAFQVDVSFLEIYNEQIRDLIMPQQSNLELREDPRNGIQIQGLSVFEVRNQNQIFELLARGNANRTQESTMTNQTSSRSHAVLMITYHNNNLDLNNYSEIKSGKLSLIDLAGSERASRTGNTGLRMKEGANINRSLLALGNCINVLYENSRTGQQNHVPFRDSKLTRILKESLTGNSKTLMIANISPSGQNYEDTLNTLKYANRTKNLKTKMKKNVVAPTSDATLIQKQNQHIHQLQGEIESLKAELAIQKQQLESNCINQQATKVIDKKKDDDELFMDIKSQINDQFNEESYKHTQLKNLYIEYENLLFFQKRLKIDIFIQGNKQNINNDQNIQKIQLLQDQLIGISSQEPNLLQRIDAIRNELKKLHRQRANLRERLYEQFKLIKRDDFYQQDLNDDLQKLQEAQQGQTLTKTQAEILETLFHSQEQVMKNNTMKMKEQRLNIKMAKKEYMITCMAEQVGLREFTNFVNTPDRRNFLSKQQIDEILQDSDAASEKLVFQQINKKEEDGSKQLPAELYCQTQAIKNDPRSRQAQIQSCTTEQLGRFICATQLNSPRKQQNFTRVKKIRAKTRASLDFLFDGNLRSKMQLNTARQKYQIKNVSQEVENKNCQQKEEAVARNTNSNSKNSNEELKGPGIQLYQPQNNKKKITMVQQVDISDDVPKDTHNRSKSARSQTMEELQKQQENLNKIQQQNLEMFYQQNYQSRQPDNDKVSARISIMSEEYKKLSSFQSKSSQYTEGNNMTYTNKTEKKTNSRYVQYMRNQALQKGTISSFNKQTSRIQNASPNLSSGSGTRITSGSGSRAGTLFPVRSSIQKAGDGSGLKPQTQPSEKPLLKKSTEIIKQSQELNMQYYITTQKKHTKRKPSQESKQSDYSDKGLSTPAQQPHLTSCASASVAASPSNRTHLYKAMRNSSKTKKKLSIDTSPNNNGTIMIQDLQLAVDEVSQRMAAEFDSCHFVVAAATKNAKKSRHQHTHSYQPTTEAHSLTNTLANTMVNTVANAKEMTAASSSGEKQRSQSSRRGGIGGRSSDMGSRGRAAATKKGMRTKVTKSRQGSNQNQMGSKGSYAGALLKSNTSQQRVSVFNQGGNGSGQQSPAGILKPSKLINQQYRA